MNRRIIVTGIAVILAVLVISLVVIARDDTPSISAECRTAIADWGVGSRTAREACPPEGPGTAEHELTDECRTAIINYGSRSRAAGEDCPAEVVLGY